MSVLSRLRPFNPQFVLQITKNVRYAGGGHGVMEVYPSNLNHHRAKNFIHMWYVTPLIFVAIFASYKNLTEGEAVLADTPPGYKPHHWEYEKYPMTRLIQRHCGRDIALAHERALAIMDYLNEREILRKIHLQVELLMKVKKDQFGWWQRYHTAKYARIARDTHTRLIQNEAIHMNPFPNFDDEVD